MLGIIGLLVAIALLIFLAYKGVGAIPASLICSLVVILTNGMNLWTGFTESYIGGFVYFIGAYFLVFASSALFARAMDDAGCAQSIAYKFLDWFGPKRAVLVLTLTTAALTYGGVSLFVVIFAIYPIALVLLKEADISKRILPGILCLGAATFTMSALPATPQLTNVIPSQVLGTPLTAAPLMGIVAGILMFVGGYYYLHRVEIQSRAAGEHFVPAPDEDMSRFENVDRSKLPNAWISFIPMVFILASIIGFRNTFASLQLVVYAMVVATIIVFVLNWSRLTNKVGTINKGLADSVSIFNVAVIIGFGFVVRSSPAFQSFVDFALGINLHPYLAAVISTEIVAGVVGSSSGGLTIFLNALGAEYVKMGANPDVLHRLTAIAAGGLDTLPHAGGIFILLAVTKLTHKESYRHMFVVSVLIPVVVAFLCAIAAIAIY